MARALIRPRGTVAPVAAVDTGGLYFASVKENLSFVPSGCTLLDLVLGGGWCRGRMSNLIGDKSTGKTLLAMEGCAQSVRAFPKEDVFYRECESAFDEEYAEALGIPMSQINLEQKIGWTVEDMMRDVDDMLSLKSPPTMYVVDSMDAISDDAEQVRKVGEQTYGMAKAKLLHQFFRERVGKLHEAKTNILIISQVKDNINAGMFGKKYTRSGGKALDFYASQIMWLFPRGEITKEYLKQKRVIGVKVEAKNEKNKVSLPYRDCQFEITFGYGIEDIKACHAFLKDTGVAIPAGTDDDGIRALVRAKWFQIEEHFLPKTAKYKTGE